MLEKLFIVNHHKYFDTKAAELYFNIKNTHEGMRILFYRDTYNRPTVYLAHQHPKFAGRTVPYDYYDVVYGIWTMTEVQANELYNHITKGLGIPSYYCIHTRRRTYEWSPKLEVLHSIITAYTGE